MHELYKLKEMLCKELEEYGSKGELTGGTLEVVDKLAHAAKNLDKIIEAYEMESEGSSYGSYRRGSSYEGGESGQSRRGGSSRAGGSYRGGSYEGGSSRAQRRDSMGRYSRRNSYGGDTEEYVEQLEEMMQEVPPEARQHIQKAIEKMEQM